jgi:hypothetical protein
MFSQKLSTQLRIIAAALLLTCATGRSVQALPDALRFRQQASIGSYAQLVTAALTLPADIFAAAHPDDNRLKLLNHGLKLVNEALATYLQKSPYSASWACFDVAQSAKALSALMAKTQPTEAANADDELTIEDAAEITAPITAGGAPVNAQQWQTFVRYANYVLASAEAATRMIAALENNNPAFAALGNSLGNKFVGSMAQRSEFNHGLTSLIRLTRYCLQAPDKKQMAVLLVLVVAEVAILVWQYKQPVPASQATSTPAATTTPTTTKPAATATQTVCIPGGVQANHPTLILVQGARPFRDNQGAVIAARPPFDLGLFDNSLGLFAIDQRVQNNTFGQCIACETAFDQWCRNHNIAPFFDLQGMQPAVGDVEATRLHNAFGDFWPQARRDADAHHRPAFIRPLDDDNGQSTGNVRDFCRRFAQAHPAIQQAGAQAPRPATVTQPAATTTQPAPTPQQDNPS